MPPVEGNANVRRAAPSDRDAVLALWDEFAAAGPPPPWVDGADAARAAAVRDLELSVRDGTAAVATAGDEIVGFAFGVFRSERAAELTDLYVRPTARRRGTARALVAAFAVAAAERGAERLLVTTAIENDSALRLYDRIGFRRDSVNLVAPAAGVAAVAGAETRGASYGSIHVQTDDMPAVERAVRQFVPRLPGRSRGSVVAPPRNGWVGIYDELCDREPRQLRRLTRELSDRLGAVAVAIGVEQGEVVRFVLFDRGREMDEYLSVQEYYGPLPPGDVVALAANPTVVARLTGADPVRVRAAARHAASPADLPPAGEIVRGLAEAIGVGGAEHGYDGAQVLPGAVVLPRA